MKELVKVYEFEIKRKERVVAKENIKPWAKATMSGAYQAAMMVRSLIGKGEYRELFYSILLDVKNRVVGVHQVAIGGEATVDPCVKDIFRAAILHGANKIVLAHNHPSGDPKPSGADWHMTSKARAAGELLGIIVVDHVIVGDEDYYSMFENDFKEVKDEPVA
jgi:DNA repair protein RadC